MSLCHGGLLGYPWICRKATKVAKMLINAADSEDSERVLEALAGRIAAGSDELQEGLAAFREKRSPDFS